MLWTVGHLYRLRDGEIITFAESEKAFLQKNYPFVTYKKSWLPKINKRQDFLPFVIRSLRKRGGADIIFCPQGMKRTLLEKYYHYKFKISNLLLEPYFLIKIYFMPGGSTFVAYDYSIAYRTIFGKRVATYANDLHPHLFQDEKEIDLPIKNQLCEVGFNNVDTEYTNKHFFIDTKKQILYLKKADLASFGDFASSSCLVEYIHRKHRVDYALEALDIYNLPL